jgi:hypothetical protein
MYEIYYKAFKERDAKFANGGTPGAAKLTGQQNLLADLEAMLVKINKKLDDAKSDEKRTVLNAKRHFYEAIKNGLEGKPHLNDQYLRNSDHFADGGGLEDDDDGKSLQKPGAAAPRKKGKMKEEPFAPKVRDVKVGGKKAGKGIEVEEEEEVDDEEDDNEGVASVEDDDVV